MVGKVPLLLSHRIVSAQPADGRLSLELAGPDGAAKVETDHLVLATGYRADISRLDFLSPELRQRIALVEASPRLDDAFQSSVPNLYFAGLAAANTFGPLQRFAFGAKFAARRMSAALKRQ